MLRAKLRRLLSTGLALDDVAVTCAKCKRARVSCRPSVLGSVLRQQSSVEKHG